MRTRSEYLIQKRDGRLQHLRATKLARSLRLALLGRGSGGGVGVGLGDADAAPGHDVLACELAEAILTAIGAVREQARIRGVGGCAGIPAPRCRITTRELAEVAAGALRQCGHADAAERYREHRAVLAHLDRDRRALRAERVDPAPAAVASAWPWSGRR